MISQASTKYKLFKIRYNRCLKCYEVWRMNRVNGQQIVIIATRAKTIANAFIAASCSEKYGEAFK